ncbi:WD40 repeat domain containing protein [Aphelenchoides fujianensis]|nr:WD40 repeat domain containing protein [Aphelenchoides fujianensis]
MSSPSRPQPPPVGGEEAAAAVVREDGEKAEERDDFELVDSAAPPAVPPVDEPSGEPPVKSEDAADRPPPAASPVGLPIAAGTAPSEQPVGSVGSATSAEGDGFEVIRLRNLDLGGAEQKEEPKEMNPNGKSKHGERGAAGAESGADGRRRRFDARLADRRRSPKDRGNPPPPLRRTRPPDGPPVVTLESPEEADGEAAAKSDAPAAQSAAGGPAKTGDVEDAYADVAKDPLLGQRPSNEVLQLLNEQSAAERRAHELQEKAEQERQRQAALTALLGAQPNAAASIATSGHLAQLPLPLLQQLQSQLTIQGQQASAAAADSKIAVGAMMSLGGNTAAAQLIQTQSALPAVSTGSTTAGAETRKRKEVYRWSSNMPVFAMAWSHKKYPDQRLRLACSSIRDGHELLKNTMSIVEFDEEHGELAERTQVFIGAPSCELRFIPNADASQPDLIASATRELRIYSYHPEQKENKSYAYAGPLTSVDWNEADPRIIGGSSIDSTCTIWDVEAQESIGVVPPQTYAGDENRRLKYEVRTQLIAHERPVHDLAFSKLGSGRDYFASCGADGSVRMFDLRNLRHSTILYEHPEKEKLNQVCWNKVDPSQFVTVADDSNKLIICDVRMPCHPVCEYSKHTKPCNSVDWAPHSPTHLCSGSSDRQALIWQLQTGEEPLLAYQSEGEITRIRWCSTYNNWIGIAFSNFLEILRV